MYFLKKKNLNTPAYNCMYIYCQQNQNRAQKCIFKNMVKWTNLQLKFRLSKISYSLRSILYPFRPEDWSTLKSNFNKTPSIDYTM